MFAERSVPEADVANVSTTVTHINVAHLQPSSVYFFSVTAETEAGQGPFTNITTQTGMWMRHLSLHYLIHSVSVDTILQS